MLVGGKTAALEICSMVMGKKYGGVFYSLVSDQIPEQGK